MPTTLQKAVKVVEALNGRGFEPEPGGAIPAVEFGGTDMVCSVDLIGCNIWYEDVDLEEDLTVEKCRQKIVDYAKALLETFGEE